MTDKGPFRFIYLKMQLANPAHVDRWIEVGLLTDTRSRLSIVPRSLLERLDIQPMGKRRFRILGGGERETGGVVFKYRGRIAPAPVVVGEDHETPILGLRALESLGFQVDPHTGQLNPTELLL